jgi:hypothetical protein
MKVRTLVFHARIHGGEPLVGELRRARDVSASPADQRGEHIEEVFALGGQA